MTVSPAALRDALVRLHRLRRGQGLAPEPAQRLADAIERGAGPEAWASSGLDPRLVAAASVEGLEHPAALVADLARAGAVLAEGERSLRAVGAHPLTLAASVAIAGAAIVLVGLPAFDGAVRAPGVTLGAVALLICVASVAALVGLAVFTWGRLPFDRLLPAVQALDTHAFVRRAAVLTSAGVDVASALRLAAEWLPPQASEAGRALGRALESGSDAPELEPLLSSLEAAMLVASARRGGATDVCEALAASAAARSERALRTTRLRVEVLSACFAGAAVLALGATLFLEYGRVLAG